MTRLSALVGRLRLVETVNEEIDVLSNLLDTVYCHGRPLASGSIDRGCDTNGETVDSCHTVTSTDSLLTVQCNHVELNENVYKVDGHSGDSGLDFLVSYAFERRFGWSESDSTSDSVHYRRLSIIRRSATIDMANMAAYMQEDLRFKTRINECLDRFITWWVNLPLKLTMNYQVQFIVQAVNLLK
jgi:hypothetical protein